MQTVVVGFPIGRGWELPACALQPNQDVSFVPVGSTDAMHMACHSIKLQLTGLCMDAILGPEGSQQEH